MFSVQLIFVMNSSSQFGWKRKQLNSKVFERFSVEGVQRKVFHEVWRKGMSSQCIRRRPAFGLTQSCLQSHYPSSKMFMPWFLHTKATLLALWISWLSRGLLRGAPRMSGSVSYTVAWIRLQVLEVLYTTIHSNSSCGWYLTLEVLIIV